METREAVSSEEHQSKVDFLITEEHQSKEDFLELELELQDQLERLEPDPVIQLVVSVEDLNQDKHCLQQDYLEVEISQHKRLLELAYLVVVLNHLQEQDCLEVERSQQMLLLELDYSEVVVNQHKQLLGLACLEQLSQQQQILLRQQVAHYLEELNKVLQSWVVCWEHLEHNNQIQQECLEEVVQVHQHQVLEVFLVEAELQIIQ
jgi:hypothetical protein